MLYYQETKPSYQNATTNKFQSLKLLKYFSPISVFCNKKGCLTNVDNSIVAWDEAHLTEKGSIYLISKFDK